MKLHYCKILLFSIPLNILVTSSHAHNKNKPYNTTRHTSNTTSRVLSECDLYVSNYDDDADMKSVKENFDRQTSQRFEEYNEHMNKKRQKCKEQCDKDIQEIIVKDKINKSLEEKVEKVCLRCGCGLGVVAAGVGIIGSVAVKGLENAAMLVAAQKGIEVGMAKAIEKLGEIYGLIEFSYLPWAAKINGTNFFHKNSLVLIVGEAYNKCTDVEAAKGSLFCQAMEGLNKEPGVIPVKVISEEAAKAAIAASEAAKAAEKAQIGEVTTASSNAYTAIGYSVTAILIIVLVMVIIYLILRYRRKKKMNKKLQYTKLLNQ
ncbi:PIR protein, putative [Plasmodium sp. gorilla clade G1]|nr:PIR protein, putative [Plasmodium sp. gorilla clade G1]